MERIEPLQQKKPFRGRFAPSPTGEMHLGNAWAALLSWLLVRKNDGVMVLRIEDLDPDRSRPEYTARLLQDIKWLGLDWDEGPDAGGAYGPYCQNQRRPMYQQALDVLMRQELLYPCYCSRARLQSAASAPHANDAEAVYPGFCRYLAEEERETWRRRGKAPAWRLQVPAGVWCFRDGVYGEIAQDIGREVGDFIVCRADGVAAYQLAVVVDDAAMAVNCVVRGNDLLTSTPRQLLLYHLLGLPAPDFTHVPLLCVTDGRRLAKRENDLTLAALRRQCVLPEMVVGYLAWKAGLIDHYQPVKAYELVNGFDSSQLRRESVLVEEDFLKNPSGWMKAKK